MKTAISYIYLKFPTTRYWNTNTNPACVAVNTLHGSPDLQMGRGCVSPLLSIDVSKERNKGTRCVFGNEHWKRSKRWSSRHRGVRYCTCPRFRVRVNAGVYRELAVREHKRFRFSPKEEFNITGKIDLRLSPRSYRYSGEFGCWCKQFVMPFVRLELKCAKKRNKWMHSRLENGGNSLLDRGGMFETLYSHLEMFYTAKIS